jgi:deoxyxylulose-5-phosphate synthase
MIDDALTHERVVTVEDGTPRRRRHTLMVSALRSRAQDLARPFPTTRILGTPRAYLEQHRPDKLLAELGLDPRRTGGRVLATPRRQPEFAPVLPESPRPNYQ